MSARRLRNVGATLFLALAVSVLVLLITGQVRLVTTHGVSMLPRFHTGDLAIIERAPAYHVGEIVGYYSPLLRIVVLHRIVADHAGRFIFKGDNNSFLDPLKLSSSYIRGRLIARIPHGGEVLAWVRSPIGLGIIAFFLFAFGVGWSTRAQRLRSRKARFARRARRSSTGLPGARPVPKHAAASTTAGVGWWPVAVPIACACVFGAMTIGAFVHPDTRTGMRRLSYEQQVQFSYTSKVKRSAVYPSGSIPSGEPVFLKLADAVDVNARYRFSLDTDAGVAKTAKLKLSGTIATTVDVTGSGGWSAQVASVRPVHFSGSTADTSVEIPLGSIASLEHAFGDETGVPLDPGTIVITPSVVVRGSVAHTPVRDSFAPNLEFQLSATELTLAQSIPTVGTGDQALDPQTSGSVNQEIRLPGTVSLFGRTVGVSLARRLAALAFVASLVAILCGFAWRKRRQGMDEAARIRASHGDKLVTVSTSPAIDAPLVVDVETFAGLARLAERYDCVILHHVDFDPQAHTYYVECGATVYRYGTEPPRATPRGDDSGSPDDQAFRGGALRSLA